MPRSLNLGEVLSVLAASIVKPDQRGFIRRRCRSRCPGHEIRLTGSWVSRRRLICVMTPASEAIYDPDNVFDQIFPIAPAKRVSAAA
jgi:hypothetical protein